MVAAHAPSAAEAPCLPPPIPLRGPFHAVRPCCCVQPSSHACVLSLVSPPQSAPCPPRQAAGRLAAPQRGHHPGQDQVGAAGGCPHPVRHPPLLPPGGPHQGAWLVPAAARGGAGRCARARARVAQLPTCRWLALRDVPICHCQTNYPPKCPLLLCPTVDCVYFRLLDPVCLAVCSCS